MLKKRSERLFSRLLWVIFFLTPPVRAHIENSEEIDLDSFSISADFSEDEEFSFDTDLPNANCEPQFNTFQIVQLLTDSAPIAGYGPLELQNIVQLDFYRYTNPIVIRSLHELPSMYPLLYGSPRWGVSAEGFFNQTRKVFLTKHSPCLLSYIELIASDDFLNLLDQKDFGSLNIPDVLPLFGNITLEERRFGVMLSGWRHYKNWIFSAALPVCYLEHNFFLSPEKRKELLDTSLFSGQGTSFPGLNLDTFVNQHLVRDKAGIGDLRLQVFYELVGKEKQQVQFGGQMTFPTAHTVKNGILGGTACKTQPPPLIDFAALINLGACALELDNNKASWLDLKELSVGYGIQALNRLTEILADTSLGQQHFSIGPMFHAQQPFLHNHLDIECFAEIEYLAPANEIRFFKVVKNPADFQRDYNSEELAEDNLNFLNQQATTFLYPAAAKIKVKPGLIFHAWAQLNGYWEDFSGSIGYDIWAQRQEQFGCLKQQCTENGTGPLNLAAGRKHGALEGKVFASLTTTLCGDGYDMRFAFRGDATVNNIGIGRSFTLGLNFILEF